jgi:hypothetical protein
MSDSLSRAGHEIENHAGESIRITREAVKALDMRGYLHRNRITGKKQIKPELIDVLAEMEYGTPLMNELGYDFSGPMVCICKCEKCRRCEADVDRTMTPNMQAMHGKAQVDAALKAVKAGRR